MAGLRTVTGYSAFTLIDVKRIDRSRAGQGLELKRRLRCLRCLRCLLGI